MIAAVVPFCNLAKLQKEKEDECKETKTFEIRLQQDS